MVETPEKGKLLPGGYTYLSPETRIEPPRVEGLRDLVERVYVQPPPIFFAGERVIPPFFNDKFRLRVPVDIAQILRATSVHQREITGRGVRVAMPDSGFTFIPIFSSRVIISGRRGADVMTTRALLRPRHGECANLLPLRREITLWASRWGRIYSGLQGLRSSCVPK